MEIASIARDGAAAGAVTSPAQAPRSMAPAINVKRMAILRAFVGCSIVSVLFEQKPDHEW
jgi:hypothetical protein